MQDEALLDLLKFLFIALMYAFLFRVVAVVVKELRDPQAAKPAKRGGRQLFQLRFVEPEARAGELVSISGEMSVGRAGGCAIVLSDDTFVSQVHARVYQQANRVFVEDLGSTNGTFVNGHQIQTPTRLRRGDTVRFGQTVAEVVK